MSVRICANPSCGASFSPVRTWQKYCSSRCRLVVYNQEGEADKMEHVFRDLVVAFDRAGLPFPRLLEILKEEAEK